MYLDIEVLGDRYEEMQELLQQIAQEELQKNKFNSSDIKNGKL